MGLAAGSLEFIDKLLQTPFLSPRPFVNYMRGEDVNGYNLTATGFTKPTLVSDKEGLRMKVPPRTFSLLDVVEFSDRNIPIDVIDVALQSDMKMPLGQFVDLFLARPRERILNVLSFEYSQTKLASLVRPPHVVKELSLVDNCWPEDDDGQRDDYSSCDTDCVSSLRPNVQKYCLMSMGDSYTDFHIDFGGSSVWYHILWGEKIFYVAPPTRENLEAYWRWNGMADNRYVYFPDLLPLCKTDKNVPDGRPMPQVARLHMRAGETILLPAGWIHAVYTPCDSLVFGGNFLTQLAIPLQLSVYRMEQKQGTAQRFLFPYFEKLHWYASDLILGRLKNDLLTGQEPLDYQLRGAHSLLKYLRRWYERHRNKPKNERAHYLPPRYYLQYTCPTLICKLEEVLHEFANRVRTAERQRNRNCHASGDCQCMISTDSSLPSTSSPFSCKRIRPLETPCCSKCDCVSPSSQPISETDEVLEAVPELKNSRLVGDHYVYALSGSDEEGKGHSTGTRRRHRSRLGGSTSKTSLFDADDPDPTWRPSLSPRKRSKRKATSSTSSNRPLSGHPLFVSDSLAATRFVAVRKASETAPKKQRAGTSKSRGTARERLARKLGL
ncbi:Lsd1/2 complex PHD finger containing protein Phf2 [Sparganum proliferum]